METKFQTSFIPKKPLTPSEKVHVKKKSSVFSFISMLIFIASVAGAAFVVLWSIALTKTQDNYKAVLAEKEQEFDLEAIEDIKRKSVKIDLTRKLLDSHISVSEVLNILSRLTVDGVYFTELEYTAPGTDELGQVKMAEISVKGRGRNFSSVAFQSDVFGESDKYGLNKVLLNPVISDLTILPNNQIGFVLTANIDLQAISYSKLVKPINP